MERCWRDISINLTYVVWKPSRRKREIESRVPPWPLLMQHGRYIFHDYYYIGISSLMIIGMVCFDSIAKFIIYICVYSMSHGYSTETGNWTRSKDISRKRYKQSYPSIYINEYNYTTTYVCVHIWRRRGTELACLYPCDVMQTAIYIFSLIHVCVQYMYSLALPRYFFYIHFFHLTSVHSFSISHLTSLYN